MKFIQLLLILFFSVLFISSCKKRGCADPDALNFDPNASKDDHSCYYYWIGQHYGGGDVFYIDRTKKHGLICTTFYIQKGYPWGCLGYDFSKVTSTAVGSGAQNTENIVNRCGHQTIAGSCYDLDTMGYDDWYLPSKEEVRALANTLGKLQQANLTGAYHTSSSMDTSGNVWSVYMPNQAAIPMNPQGCFVRPVRSF